LAVKGVDEPPAPIRFWSVTATLDWRGGPAKAAAGYSAMSPHHRYQHQFGGAFPKQVGGSSRAVDKENPMLWKIWLSLTDRILVNVESLGTSWVFYRSLPDEK
jgi:hypothetical protein